MAVKLTEHPLGHMIDFGDDVRIERTHLHVKKKPLLDDKGQPVMTTRGHPVHEHVPHVDDKGNPVVDDKGEPVYMWNVYQRVANEPVALADIDGNPVLDDKGEPVIAAELADVFTHAHHGGPTNETHTWLHVFEGAEKEARAKARELVGEK